MTSILSRRSAIKSFGIGVGAAAVGGTATAGWQRPAGGYAQLQLNANGRRQLVPQVEQLDDHEEHALEHFDAGGRSLLDDLRQIEGDATGLRQNPGFDLAPSQRGGFRNECEQLLQLDLSLCRVLRTGRRCGQGQFDGFIRCIDFFVSHWYPCNELLEISHCQARIWHFLSLPVVNWTAIMAYSHHVDYEFQGMFQYHAASHAQFGSLSARLLSSEQTVFDAARGRNLALCRSHFVRFSQETTEFCGRFYRQWCG